MTRRDMLIERLCKRVADATRRTDRDSLRKHPSDETAPGSRWKLQDAAQRLGFALPESLFTVYSEVADGGFGPGFGLLPIVSVVAEYEKLRSFEGRTPWPEAVLPITDIEAEQYCIRAPGGEILRFDPDRLDDDNSNLSDCFLPIAEDLFDWLEAWLDYNPEAERAEVDRLVGTHGTPRWFEAWVVRVRQLSPEQRAGLGEAGDDWEERARRRLLKPS